MCHTHLKAGSVQVHLVVPDIGVLGSHLITAGEEQPICPPHDVGLVDGRHVLPAIGPGIREGKLCHTVGSLPSDQLDALNHTINNLECKVLGCVRYEGVE